MVTPQRADGHILKARWSHSTVASPMCHHICDRLDQILNVFGCLGKHNDDNTARMQYKVRLEWFLRTNYAKWVVLLILVACGGAMLDVSVQHSRNTFDPEWISLGHTLPVSAENWERSNLETFEVGVTQTHDIFRFMLWHRIPKKIIIQNYL